jgi:hypothetical protein
MPKRDAEPQEPAFVPIEHTPIWDNPDVETPFTPIEVTPYVPVAPVTEHTEPATGNTEGN